MGKRERYFFRSLDFPRKFSVSPHERCAPFGCCGHPGRTRNLIAFSRFGFGEMEELDLDLEEGGSLLEDEQEESSLEDPITYEIMVTRKEKRLDWAGLRSLVLRTRL